MLKRQGLSFLKSLPITNTPPFILVIGTLSAHTVTPAPQYNDTDSGQKSPRIPLGEVALSPTGIDATSTKMNAPTISQSDQTYDFRHGTLKSDMI